VTSYVGFFNYDTTDCNDSSFHYWWGGYKPPSDKVGPIGGNRIVYLTTDLRSELDGLVDQLNGVIQQAINEANSEWGGSQVHYVNMQPYFDVHRWCESGPWHEPDPSVESTYFFLSAWPDFPISTDAVVSLFLLLYICISASPWLTERRF
jgi:hypothetical protein